MAAAYAHRTAVGGGSARRAGLAVWFTRCRPVSVRPPNPFHHADRRWYEGAGEADAVGQERRERLGSPAVAVNAAQPGGWLDRFLSGARQRGYRVDFITMHWYGSDFSDAATGHLKSYIQAVYNRYRLPIWLTEYALIKFTDAGSVYPSDAQQAAFVKKSTAMLQSLSYVERYAWFALPTPDGKQGTGLYRNGTTPTAAGRAYRAA